MKARTAEGPPRVRPGETLCALAELDDPGSKEFLCAYDNGDVLPFFVVRRGGEAFAYVNICPHQFLPLNWKNDLFLNLERTRILCVMHAATFDIASGEALSGPCPGTRLEPVPIRIEDGTVVLATAGLPEGIPPRNRF